MLILLARLGLRAHEVAGLHLDDLDWRAGELLIRGKGQRTERMPLPQDVRTTLADYLNRRPRDATLLRHTAAMSLLRAGVDSVVIALWLGHEQVSNSLMRWIGPEHNQ